MPEANLNREAAWELLCQHNDEERSRRHARAVEHVMRYMAKKHGEDEELWGVVGLLHDLDWEKYPKQHGFKSVELMTAAGWPEVYTRAVMSHGWNIFSDVEPKSLMEKTLYAVDELTGLIHAAALVRPNRAIDDMKYKSIKKKWKDKSFAAGVNRGIIEQGVQLLGIELPDLVTETIAAMREIANELGLDQHKAQS